MNKDELIRSVAWKCGMKQADVRRCLDTAFGTIGDELQRENDVSLSDFGKFYPSAIFSARRRFSSAISARMVRLPDGRVCWASQKKVIRFRPFANLRYYSTKH